MTSAARVLPRRIVAEGPREQLPTPTDFILLVRLARRPQKTPQDAFLATLGDAARLGGTVGTLWTPRCNVGRFWRPDGRFSRVFSRCKRCAS